ncbi:hypothetical protein ACFFQW_42770 [Umezawaea endophytica]|uniref:Secreted protein n=1 Tax=Umezawaea endophytica TaxID=1654476 RepID=A0A9X2VRA3_9PSEU|nr:hypothetical protein [Umezawaea endophytica]MCS7481189.1 hypothetical protein [Umezawaea endophytica]
MFPLPALRHLVALSVLFTTAPAVESWTAGACPSSAGVTVAVDLTGAGGPGTVVRCAPGDPGTARAALERAGFAVHAGTGTGFYGDTGYVCRVERLPAADACDGHSGGEPYWKVWRVGLDPLAWRGSGTGGGPGALRVCPDGLVGFSFGVGTPERPNTMTVSPEHVVTRPGWLPPTC